VVAEDDTAVRGRLRRNTALCWVWTFAAFTVWSLATPLWTSPDAPAHDLMAYHAVRDLSIEPTDVYSEGVTTNAITRAPRGLVQSAQTIDCYRYQATPANCLAPPTDDEALVDFVNPAGRNMPTYYLATGWPTFFVSVPHAVWAERVAASAIAALMVAWAFGAAMTRVRKSVAVTGLVMAVTPMTMYLGGAVNPNALEIVAGLALAACSVVFLQDGPTWLGRVMFRHAMIAATLMVTIRMLAPVWVLAWAVAFALLATRRHWAHVLSRRGLAWTALPVAGALFDLFWTLTSGITDYQAEPKYAYSLWTSLKMSQDQVESLTVLQQVGDYGWLDTPMPNGVYIRVLFAVLFLGFTAFLWLSTRQMVTVGWLFLAQYALPILMQAAQLNTNGLVWQGRYTLPLTVMVPVFLMMYAAPRVRAETWPQLVRVLAWSYPVAVLLLLSAHWRGLLVELRRNASGFNGPTILSGVWQPPLVSALTLIIVHVVLLAVVLALVLKLYSDDYAKLDRPVLGSPNPWRRGLELPRRAWRRA
jgi:hypothetical protein